MRNLLISFILCAVVGSAGAETSPLAGDWKGKIILPSAALEISVHLTQTASGWTGTIDIPAQAAKGLALGNFVVAEDSITFAIGGVPGEPTFHGAREDSTIKGPFTQGGQTFEFVLERGTLEAAVRPQDPVPPFPYDSEDITFAHDHVTLSGTITTPHGEGPFPAVVLLTGSGAQDRNEEIFNHRPFLVIADHLSRHGIAVLRYDDRGVGGSTGAGSEDTSADFAEDALAAVDFLRGRADIDNSRIGLLGHSEGALIAIIASEKSTDLAFVIFLAGPGVSGSDLLPVQIETLALANGVSTTVAAEQADLFRRIIALATSGRDSKKTEEEMAELFRQHIALEPASESISGEMLEQVVSNSTRQFATPWFQFFFTYDPQPALSRISIPVLALNGSLDCQVVPSQNLTGIASALKKGNNQDVTVREMPGLNHMFQHANTGALSEYPEIEETIAPEVLAIIAEWLAQR